MPEFEITRKLNHFRKQLALMYQGQNLGLLSSILSSSPIHIQEEYTFDNWNGGTYGHALTVFLSEELFLQVGDFESRNQLASQIQADFNQTSQSVPDESIDVVYLELTDPDDPKFVEAILPNEVATISGDRASFWQPGHIKLFISHKANYKVAVGQLASSLSPYGISCFVAHEDIEPTEEWIKEIEKALRSMDAILVYLTDDFADSQWTDQEVGFAIARGVPILPLKMPELNPYGFMGIYQGLPGNPDDIAWTADQVYGKLAQKFQGNSKIKTATIMALVGSQGYRQSEAAFRRLQRISDFSQEEVEQMAAGFNNNDQLHGCYLINGQSQFFNFIQRHSGNSFQMRGGKLQRSISSEIPF